MRHILHQSGSVVSSLFLRVLSRSETRGMQASKRRLCRCMNDDTNHHHHPGYNLRDHSESHLRTRASKQVAFGRKYQYSIYTDSQRTASPHQYSLIQRERLRFPWDMRDSHRTRDSYRIQAISRCYKWRKIY